MDLQAKQVSLSDALSVLQGVFCINKIAFLNYKYIFVVELHVTV